MANIERFEDLVAWQKAREPVREVYRVTSGSRLSHDWDLIRQLRRAAVSIMSNVAARPSAATEGTKGSRDQGTKGSRDQNPKR